MRRRTFMAVVASLPFIRRWTHKYQELADPSIVNMCQVCKPKHSYRIHFDHPLADGLVACSLGWRDNDNVWHYYERAGVQNGCKILNWRTEHVDS